MEKTRLDLGAIRDQLSMKRGKEYWRSLEELANTDDFKELLHREFPRQAWAWDESLNRRSFLQVMGASLALAGLSGCVKQPDEKILPYVRQPEMIIPGQPLQFATSMVMGGYAKGVLATSNMGRPTKIEGNPSHPGSLGATDIFMQASVLSLYDPDRAQAVSYRGNIRTWSEFKQAIHIPLEVQHSLKGAGIRILTGSVTSPTLANQIERFLREYPLAKRFQFDPINRDALFEGSMLAFGDAVETIYHFDKADVVLSFESDFMGQGPASVRYMRDFSDRRRVSGTKPDMSRLYVVESTPTITGTMADHRIPASPVEIELAASYVAGKLRGLDTGVSIGNPVFVSTLDAAIGELQRHRGTSLVIAGEHQPPAVHALVHAMNDFLGNNGTTVTYAEPVVDSWVNNLDSIHALVRDMNTGEVDMLVIVGGNPAYDLPADLGFSDALGKVKLSIRFGLHADETTAACDWSLPESHYLESWGDARAYEGSVGLVQPLIAPLYDSISAIELFDVLMEKNRGGHEILTEYWMNRHSSGEFESFWRKSLNDGVIKSTGASSKSVKLQQDVWEVSSKSREEEGLNILFRGDPTVWDGQFSNNGWLQELAKPITKLTWDNAALISAKTAERLHLQNNDVVEISYGSRTLEMPVWIVPGQAEDCVTVHLGYGRTQSGKVGNGAGFNAYTLRTSNAMWSGGGVKLRKTGATYALATTQHHHAMEGRGQVRAATLAEFIKDPHFVRNEGKTPSPEESLYPPHKYEGYAWGMSIDLNACTGCNACVIACQAENNIPVVGKEQVQKMREMQWIRIDSYYKGDLDNPEIYHQPVPCMHCENAPCEVVCPVDATVHDSEGLNLMVYNRCIGTRYCSNNCPYKVRRFNFLEFNDIRSEALKMVENPEVTVRSRGVMEKCSYCIQRINAVRYDAEKENREIRDGEVVTACQAACPASAIVFGDTNNKESKVSRLKAEPRDYGLLAELNTKPRTTYLGKLTNPNPKIKSAS